MVFNSTIVYPGNSILKNQKRIKFLSLPVSILYKIFALFWSVLNSSLVNITDFMLWMVKDFIFTESKLLFSSQFGTLTFSSLYILCMYLSCWGVGHVHTCPLELHHTAAWKCLYFPYSLDVFADAGHCLRPCAGLQFLQLSILNFLYCSLGCC